MKINTTNYISFGNRTKTAELIETVLMKNFKSEGTNAAKVIVKDLYPQTKATGSKGYRHYAKLVKEIVYQQKPELAHDIEQIQNHITNNPKISKQDLSEYIKPYILKHGENIDIEV